MIAAMSQITAIVLLSVVMGSHTSPVPLSTTIPTTHPVKYSSHEPASCEENWARGAQTWDHRELERVRLVTGKIDRLNARNHGTIFKKQNSSRIANCKQGYIGENMFLSANPSSTTTTLPVKCSAQPTENGTFTPVLFRQQSIMGQLVTTLALRHDATQMFLAYSNGELVLRQMPVMDTPSPRHLNLIVSMVFKVFHRKGMESNSSQYMELRDFCKDQTVQSNRYQVKDVHSILLWPANSASSNIANNF